MYGYQVDPGTYYVHIAGFDPSCAYDTCPGREWSETRILVISAPPSNSARPVLSGKVRTGKILTALPGTWGGTAPVMYSYQWQRCDLAGRSCRGIPGATSTTYQLVSADAGSTVRVAVTASNGAGSAVAYSRARAIAGVVVGVGTGMKPWRVGMAYRRGVEFLGSTAYPLNSGSGCSLGPLTASRIDRYPGVRTSWQNRHLTDVATKRIGDRSSAGFKIGIARLRAVRARHPRAIFDRTPPRRFRLGSKSVVVVRTFPAENYVALTYWFNSRGTLVALESEAGGC